MIEVRKSDGADVVFHLGGHSIPVPRPTAMRLLEFLNGSPAKRIWEAQDRIVIDDWSFAAARTSELQHQRDVSRRRVVVRVGAQQWHLLSDEVDELGRTFAAAMA